jgi:hypothetical protein
VTDEPAERSALELRYVVFQQWSKVVLLVDRNRQWRALDHVALYLAKCGGNVVNSQAPDLTRRSIATLPIKASRVDTFSTSPTSFWAIRIEFGNAGE